MKGYKVFNPDWTCRGFQFEVGHTYDTGAKKEDLKLCTNTVFHFCRELHKIEDVSNLEILENLDNYLLEETICAPKIWKMI